MSLYKNWSTDSKLEAEGVEIPFDANDDGTIPTFIVSRMSDSNIEYTKALRRATDPYKRQIDLKTLSPELDAQIFREVFCSTIVRGWSNIQDGDGNVIPYSKAAAIKLFTDLPDLYKELQVQASAMATFRAKVLEDEAKN